MASSSTIDPIPITALIHLVMVKLSSSNYLLWKKQVVISEGISSPNPEYAEWCSKDQRILSILLSSLTEEALGEVIGAITSRVVWLSLESTFAHSSISRAN